MSKRSFEEAYNKLESILEKMNSEQVSLDAALALYEEADTLIVDCQKRLSEAESRIEILVKNREGALEPDENGNTKKEIFSISKGGSAF